MNRLIWPLRSLGPKKNFCFLTFLHLMILSDFAVCFQFRCLFDHSLLSACSCRIPNLKLPSERGEGEGANAVKGELKRWRERKKGALQAWGMWPHVLWCSFPYSIYIVFDFFHLHDVPLPFMSWIDFVHTWATRKSPSLFCDHAILFIFSSLQSICVPLTNSSNLSQILFPFQPTLFLPRVNCKKCNFFLTDLVPNVTTQIADRLTDWSDR